MEETINFGIPQLLILNGILALMIFGVSLQLTVADFKRVLDSPRAPITGMFAQFLVLPGLTCAATWYFKVPPEIALGMMLVAACPGGTFSNIMTYIARGNVAVSVSMTGVSSLSAVVLTPLNFAFYGNLNPYTEPLMQTIALNPLHIILLVLLVLVIPILLGMYCGKRYADFARRSELGFRYFSIGALLLFVVLACAANITLLLQHLQMLLAVVAIHNATALLIGYSAARMLRLNDADSRAVTLEVGIQNSGIALSIIFTFFPTHFEMMLVAAFWGVWHLVSGAALAIIWNRRKIQEPEYAR